MTSPTTEYVHAPWTDEQIESLNEFQWSGVFHPFTCGTRDCGAVLEATRDGWRCGWCDYAQDWAHAWMADGQWRTAQVHVPGARA